MTFPSVIFPVKNTVESVNEDAGLINVLSLIHKQTDHLIARSHVCKLSLHVIIHILYLTYVNIGINS